METVGKPATSVVAPDPHALTWQDVKELGLDPVPAGLTEDEDLVQVG